MKVDIQTNEQSSSEESPSGLSPVEPSASLSEELLIASTSDQPSSSNPSIIKSVRSAWKKAKFRHWRRTMDLENSKTECQETQEANFDKSKANVPEKMDVQKKNSTDNSSDLPAELSSNPSGANSLSVQKPNSSCATCTTTVMSENKSSNSSEDNRKRSSRGIPNYRVDYESHLIPKLKDIFSCPFYWGKMDRYEAEALLANKPEGSFLLRDSAQENYVFSVSFRRYSRSLHARIEETKHKFSFDCHDPGVHASRDIKGLLEFYKDPLSCMFFEPMLLFPILRKKPFSLQELARTVICDNTTYNGITTLPIPKTLKSFLKEYHYKHKVASRELELQPSVLNFPPVSASTASEVSSSTYNNSHVTVQKEQ